MWMTSPGKGRERSSADPGSSSAASVQEQLRTTTQASSSHPAPHPPPPIALAAHPAVSPTTTSFPASFSLAEKIHGSVVPNLSLGEAEVVKNFLLGEQAQNYQIGQQALDWRLMQPSMAEALTQSLLDGRLRCAARSLTTRKLTFLIPPQRVLEHAAQGCRLSNSLSTEYQCTRLVYMLLIQQDRYLLTAPI